jgi:hypothetical protein
MKSLWVWVLVLAAVMQSGIPLNAFEGNILCTKTPNIQDQWRGILPGRPPVIPICSQVVRLEPFTVNVSFMNPTIKDGKVHVSAKLKMLNPAGATTFETPLQPLTFAAENAKSVFIFPDYIAVSFDPPDAAGKYVFTVDLKDENSGAVHTANASIELKDQIALAPDQDPIAALSSYHRTPTPQNIIPAFRQFLTMLPQLKQKQGNNFDPRSILSFFFHALRMNPQLHADFAQTVDALSNPEERFMGVIILHELGEKPFAMLSKESQKMWNPQLAQVFQVDTVTMPPQLDILWSEFLTTGQKAPLVKIVDAVKLLKGNLSPDDYKKIAQPTREDRESLMRFMTGMAAAWSLGSNAQQHQLAAFYLEAMLARKEIADSFTNVIISQKLNEAAKPQKPATPGTTSVNR